MIKAIIKRLVRPALKSQSPSETELFPYLKQRLGWKPGQNGKIKVAIVATNATSHPFSSFFIRLFLPLTHRSLTSRLCVELFDGTTTDIGDGFDFCIVQRTAIEDIATAQELVTNLRSSGTRLVIDTDDGFHSITPDHPEYAIHKPRLVAFEYLLSQADRLWVSTERLLALERFKGQGLVVANSLDDRLWVRKPHRVSGPLRLIYMGTVSHGSDFELVLPILESLAAKYPKAFNLTVIGVTADLPDHNWIQRLRQPPGVSLYPKFVDWFLRQGPFDIGLAPLVDSEFNRDKSDIKTLDYLATGTVPMVSDVKAYESKELDRLILRSKNSQAAWQRQLETIINDTNSFRTKAKPIIDAGSKYISSKRSSAITAELLYKDLEALKNGAITRAK